jgi:hypothetical protein
MISCVGDPSLCLKSGPLGMAPLWTVMKFKLNHYPFAPGIQAGSRDYGLISNTVPQAEEPPKLVVP